MWQINRDEAVFCFAQVAAVNQVDGAIVGFSEPKNIVITFNIDARYLLGLCILLHDSLPVCQCPAVRVPACSPVCLLVDVLHAASTT